MSVEKVIEKITAQQGKGRTPEWMAGEQLKDICRNEPESAGLIERDLDIPEMSLAKCAAKIKEFADKHRTNNFSCVIPVEAERIIREFYGLPKREERAAPAPGGIIDLADLL